MEKRALAAILLLFLLSFGAKLYYLDKTPFIEDESLYAEMIAGQVSSPSFLPEYFGYPAPWKPGLYYLTYALFLPPASMLFSSLEWAYRFPNLLFSLLSAFLVFLVAKRLAGRDAAILSALIFFSSTTALYTETRLLMEPMMLTLILASLFFYTKEKKSAADFLAAGAFALLAALTKSVIALIIPLLALIYIFTREKKSLRSAPFLLSLLGAPLGLAIFFLSLLPTGFAGDIFLVDIGRSVMYDYSGTVGFTLRNIYNVFSFFFLFVASLLALFLRRQKAEPMLAAWALFLIIPIIASTFRAWYLYYFLPPLSIFAASAMLEKNRADFFSILLASLFVLASIGLFAASFADWEAGPYRPLLDARNAGISLAGENSTLFIGSYYYNTVAICYKSLEERKTHGAPLDFGYVLMHNPAAVEDYDAYVQDFLYGYSTAPHPLESGRFAQFFWNSTPFRKHTDIGEFQTLVSCPPLNTAPPGYELTYNDGYAAIYKKQE